MGLFSVNNLKANCFHKKESRVNFAFLMLGVSVVHIFILLYFLWIGVASLAIYGVFSVLLYIAVSIGAAKGKIAVVFVLTIAEVCFQSILTAWIIGWNFGFSMYLIALVPIIFYVVYAVRPFKHFIISSSAFSFFVMSVFMAAKIIDYMHEPVFSDINEFKRLVGYIGNSFVSFAMLTIFSLFFTYEMRGFQSALETENRYLGKLAETDPLTGLMNRRSMEIKLEEARRIAEIYDGTFCIVMGDIDNFKQVNDTYGHAAGDKTLMEVSGIIRAIIRQSDYVCRWGGEEFLIVIMADEAAAHRIVERVRACISNNPVEYEGRYLKSTVTFGISSYNKGDKLEDVIACADKRLYKGKQAGKNIVVSE